MLSATLWLALGAGGLLRAETPLGTAFTYQGRLTDAGVAKDGTCDFRFRSFDAATGGTQAGSTVTKSGVAVTDGLFAVQLDFGAGAFDGTARWLQTEVMCTDPPPADPGFTLLAPRQELTAAPQALYAPEAGDADTLEGLDSSDLLNSSLVLNGSNLELTDSGGTLTADLSGLGGGGLQQTSFDGVAHYETVSVTGTTIIGVYRSTAADIGGTDYYRIPYPSGHAFDATTVKATEFWPGGEPWCAVDPEAPGVWNSDTATGSVKFNFDLGTGRAVLGLVLVNDSSGTPGVNSFSVYGSNVPSALSDTTYGSLADLTHLGTYTAEARTDRAPQHFTFSNAAEYRYIVLRIADNHGGSYIGFMHVQMLWTSPAGSAWALMQPGVDYDVARTAATGSQSLTIRVLAAGTHDIVVEHQ